MVSKASLLLNVWLQFLTTVIINEDHLFQGDRSSGLVMVHGCIMHELYEFLTSATTTHSSL